VNSAAYPPLLRRISAEFCTGCAHAIHRIPAVFPQKIAQDFSRIFDRIYICIFRNFFASIPEETSRPVRGKMGGIQAVDEICGKHASRRSRAVERSFGYRLHAGLHKGCGTWNIRYDAGVASGNMVLYMALASRLAPLLLMASAALVGTRWLHDQPALRARGMNVLAAVAWLAATFVVIVPFAARMGLMVGIRSAVNQNDWQLAAARVDQYGWFGGRIDGSLLYVRGVALAQRGELPRALADLQTAARSHDPLVSPIAASFEAAICLHALGRSAEAERAFLIIPEQPPYASRRDYFLGSLSEMRRDPRAELWYRRSLAADPAFDPSLYRLLRIVSLRHDVASAEALAADYRRLNAARASAPWLNGALEAIRRGEILVDYDPLRIRS